ncbi:hypothetical protein BDD43_1503 [Mucilaginibacter gracilis]|uniref:Uncharacterized protein n=1 Tax=Mucilaginibacter gracilis TaxID=423350 RepID=A0A495IZ42_9SPHI|nr:hypothetical protein [Mucilaginibacter gracilis]RKR81358.1 hypothetical protein BDD43_1503 [Mucilaginibacter gracilis]
MVKINITTANGFSAYELQKVEAAQQVLNNILNSDKFKERVLHFSTNGLYRFHYRKSFLGNWIDKPYSNSDVYRMLTQPDGAEANAIDLKLEMLPGGDVEQLGYTNPDTQHIYTYRNWFNSLSLAGYTSHLAHEWCHQLGFNHESKPTEKNEYSVPFGIGKITENIAWEC